MRNLETERKGKEKQAGGEAKKSEQEQEDFQPPNEERKVLSSVQVFCSRGTPIQPVLLKFRRRSAAAGCQMLGKETDSSEASVVYVPPLGTLVTFSHWHQNLPPWQQYFPQSFLQNNTSGLAAALGATEKGSARIGLLPTCPRTSAKEELLSAPLPETGELSWVGPALGAGTGTQHLPAHQPLFPQRGNLKEPAVSYSGQTDDSFPVGLGLRRTQPGPT